MVLMAGGIGVLYMEGQQLEVPRELREKFLDFMLRP
jgi:hypothetical protein